MVRVLLAAVVFLSIGPANAQTDPSWLIGTWKGEHTSRATRDDSTTFEFREDDSTIAWKMHRIYDHDRSGRRETEGTGTVTKVTDSSVELQGSYTRSLNPRNVGAKITYTFTREAPDVLKGTFAAVEGGSLGVTLKKQK